jgi:hypothetical protein
MEMRMADFTIRFMTIKQMTFGSPTCKVQILFEITGPHTGIDIVQIYAVNGGFTEPSDLHDVVDTVDLTIPEFQYSSLVDLQSGAFYTLVLCPRSKTGNVLDDKVEGEYWETFCIKQSFTTKLAGGGGGGDLPPPRITASKALPKTLHQSNGIEISWESSVSYDAWNVVWNENGNSATQVQSPELDFTGRSGSYTCRPTTLGVTYFISVEGGKSRLFGGHQWSGWSPPAKVTAGNNLHSLREFLAASGVSGGNGIRSLLPPSNSISLRSVMGI